MNLVVSHWSANVAVLAAVLAVVVVHLAGLLGLRGDAGRGGAALPGGLAREAVAFYSGLLLAVLALVSPLGYWAGTFIWVRVLQDIVLGVYVPPLIVLGAPWLVLWRGLGRAAPPRAIRATTEATAPVPPRLRSWPVAVTALFVVVWCGWYLPVLYDAGVHHPVVLAAQAVTIMAAGIALWLQIIGSRPFSPQSGPLARVSCSPLSCCSAPSQAWCSASTPRSFTPPTWGSGTTICSPVVSDQQGGGAELRALVLEPYVIAGVALLVRWLNEEESQALSAGLDRMLRPPKHTWPTRTGTR